MERFEFDGERMQPAPRVRLTDRTLGYADGRPVPPGFAVSWAASFTRVGAERRIDLVSAGWPAERVERAIWTVDGDRLTICIGRPYDPRPTDYSAPKGSGRYLIVLRRVGD